MGKNESDAKALAEALPKLKEGYPRELAEAMMSAWLDEHRADAHAEVFESDPIKLRKSIKTLGTAATNLTAALENLPVLARWQIADELDASRMTGLKHARLVTGLLSPSEGMDFLRLMTAASNRMAEAAARAGQARPFPKRKHKKLRRIESVADLAEVFKFLTGKNPSRKVRDNNHPQHGKDYGEFFEFVRVAFRAADGRDRGAAEMMKQWAAERRTNLFFGFNPRTGNFISGFFNANPQWGKFGAAWWKFPIGN